MVYKTPFQAEDENDAEQLDALDFSSQGDPVMPDDHADDTLDDESDNTTDDLSARSKGPALDFSAFGTPVKARPSNQSLDFSSFGDKITVPASPPLPRARPAQAQADLFADVPMPKERPASAPQVAAEPDIPLPQPRPNVGSPAPDDYAAPLEDTGAFRDIYGSQKGMLTGDEAYEEYQGKLKSAEAAVAEAETRLTGIKERAAAIPDLRTARKRGSTAETQRLTIEAELENAQKALDVARNGLSEIRRSSPPTVGKTRDALTRAATSIITGPMDIIGGAARPIDAALDATLGTDTGVSSAMRKGSEQVTRAGATDPTRDKEFVAQVGAGAGSSLVFVLTGFAGRALDIGAGVSAGVAGGLQQAEQNYREADRLGAPAYKKALAYLAGGGIGATEGMIGLGRMPDVLAKMDTATGGGVKRYFGLVAREMGEEGVQNGLQQLLQNIADYGILGKDPGDITKDVWEQALIGAVVGMGFTGVVGSPALLGGKEAERAIPQPEAAVPTPEDIERQARGEAAAAPAPPQGQQSAAAAPSPSEESPAPQPAVSATERRVLRKKGWQDDQIDGMNRAEAEQELGEAAEQGIDDQPDLPNVGRPAPANDQGVDHDALGPAEYGEQAAAEALANGSALDRARQQWGAADQPTAEPASDIAAQARDLQDKNSDRNAVWLPRATVEHLRNVGKLDDVLKAGVPMENFDGDGGILVAKNRNVARVARKLHTQKVSLQAIVGGMTGSGTGKPADAQTVVQQKNAAGNVTQESAVSPGEGPAVAATMAEPGRQVEEKPVTEAIAERAAKVQAEEQAPDFSAQGVPAEGAGTRQSPAKVNDPLDVARAESRVNTEPTEAQKEAGNYKKGHVRWNGLDITIENPKGSTRSGTDAKGQPWQVEMPAAYGYVKRSKGKDGDQVDVYLGPQHDAAQAFVIDQYDPDTGKFDEHKVMLGFQDQASAQAAYNAAFSDGSGPRRGLIVTPVEPTALKEWLRKGARKKPFGAPVQMVAPAQEEKPDFSTLGEPAKRPTPEEASKHREETTAGWSAEMRERLLKPIQMQAADSDETVTVRLTEKGPWDFNDTFPAPNFENVAGRAYEGRPTFGEDEDALDVEGVVSTVDESINEIIGYLSEARALRQKAEDIRSGKEKLKRGQSKEQALEGVKKDAQRVVQSLRDMHSALLDDFTKEGVAAMTRHARAILASDKPPAQTPAEQRAEAEAAKPKEKKPKKPIGPSYLDRLENYFRVGRIYKAYMGFDKVLGFERLPDGGWQVRVQEIKNGETVGSPRTHATAPSKKDLEVWEKQHPVPAPAATDETTKAPETGPSDSGTKAAEETQSSKLADRFIEHFRDGGDFKNILVARKMAKDAGFDEDAKAVEEALELAVVKLGREIAAGPDDAKAKFTALVDLYSRQPKLGTRTSTSMRDQAFSTPIPLAYIASRLAHVSKNTTVFEPTAGNGALLIEANPKKAQVNEINSERADNLQAQGFRVSQRDAAEKTLRHRGYPVEVVLANPPFGAVRQEGESKVFDLSDIQKGYQTKEIDHAIALRALEALGDDGRAVLIVGGLNKLAASPEARSDAYNGKAKREFFKVLYDRYNVTDHFTVAGELYERQGAGWPVDVIVIDGRGKSKRALPAVDVPRVLSTWDEIGGLLDAVPGTGDRKAGVTPERPADEAGPGRRNGRMRGGGERVSEPEPAPGEREPVQSGSVERSRDERSGDEGRRERPAGDERRDAERAGVKPPPKRRASGLADDFDSAFDKGMVDVFGPQEGPKSSQGDDDQIMPEAKGRPTPKSFWEYQPGSETPTLEQAIAAGAVPASSTQKEWDKLSPGYKREIVRSKTKQDERQTADVAKSAAKNVAESADSAMAGLVQLFGGGKTVSSGLSFDEDTYAKAKPLFVQAAQKFVAFKDDMAELVRRMVGEMHNLHGLTRDALEAMRPYLRRFMEDVQAGVVSLTGREQQKKPAPKATEKTEREPVAQEQETATQVAYAPKSGVNGLGTLVPVNMRTSIQESLAELESRVGNLDKYVADQLGYDVNDLADYFAAEQVDALALAIDNLERGKGFIIGDQTGIGKGRVNAAIIRWAIKRGRIPTFVTEKPNLYRDMYRDLTDIGIQDFLGREPRILATNSDLAIPLNEDGDVTLQTGSSSDHGRLLGTMTAKKFVADYDMVFTTYSQMQTVGGKDTTRRAFLAGIAPKSVLIFDESHNAGGQGKAVQTKGPSNRSGFARDLVATANGVFYSSATYAKRPDVMDLYAATDMVMAVEKIEDLAEAIARGGVPMQQVVAAMLAKAGQYIRRERSFAGITYDTVITPVSKEQYDGISTALAAIQDFSLIVADATDGLDQQIKAQATAILGDNATGSAGASSTLFTSIMHNIVNQMLLAMKAKGAAELAIEAIRRGEKPIFTVANTMESFLTDYAAEAGVAHGEAMDVDFSQVLRKYLDRTRTLILKRPFSDKPVEHKYLTDEELGKEGRDAYKRAVDVIEKLDLSDLPVSPIDRIKQALADAGYKVGEITGRGTIIDYSDAEPILRGRPTRETSIKGRIETNDAFNSGELDAILLNQAGSTGLSLHASEKFKDQRKRLMLIVQPESNIDVQMQLLGRPNRTGQVVKPAYGQLVADIPAEKRPAAVLAKKMASLNANTTASRGGALTAKDVPDFLNEYGDKIAATIIGDDPELNRRLGSPVKTKDNGTLDIEDAMRRLTGRIPLLPLQEQEELYERLETEYVALLEQMEAAGENALEAKTLDLKARPLERIEVVPAKKGSKSPFAAPVYIEKTSIVRQGKPFSAVELMQRLGDEIGATGPMDHAIAKDEEEGAAADMLGDINDPNGVWGEMAYHVAQDQRSAAIDEFAEFTREELGGLTSPEKQEKERVRLNAVKDRWSPIHEMLPTGARLTLKTGSGNKTAIVIKTERTGKTKNPLALSSWKATFAVADGERQITVPFSRLYEDGKSPEEDKTAIELRQVGWAETPAQTIERFAMMQKAAREDRFIATGNLLAAYAWLNRQGRIINYTDEEGHLRQGILTAKDFDVAEHFSTKARSVRDPAEVVAWVKNNPGKPMYSEDDVVRLDLSNGRFFITTEAAKRTGGVYYLDKKLTELVGNDFYKRGPMVAEMWKPSDKDMTAVVKRLQELGAVFVDRTQTTLPPVEKIAPPKDEEAKASIERAQTETAEFKRWFGNSKVVDAEGRPQTVYHATDAEEFDAFELSHDIGFHFGTAAQANDRLKQTRGEGLERWDGARIIPSYLSIKNPLRLPDLHDWEPRAVLAALEDAGVLTSGQVDKAIDRGEEIDREFVRKALAEEGYDGIVYANETEGRNEIRPGVKMDAADSWIALSPEQIKSATDNRGTFDPADDRINASLAATAPYTPAAGRKRKLIERAVFDAVAQVAGIDAARRTAAVETVRENSRPGWNVGEDNSDFEATAAYFPRRETSGVNPLIMVSLASRDAVKAAYHEGWHAVEGTLSPDDVQILERETPRLRDFVARQNPGIAGPIRGAEQEEVWAESAALYTVMRERGEQIGGIHIAARRIFEKIRNVLARIKNALHGLGFKSASDIFEDFARGEMATRRAGLAPEDRRRWWKAGEVPRASIRRRQPAEDDLLPPPETARQAWDPNVPFKQRLSDAVDALLLNPARSFWDRQIDLLRFQKASEAMGRRVSESLDTYLAATLYPGKVGERMKDQIKTLWNPVYDAMKERGVGRDELHDYLYARHAPERNAEIRKIDPDNPAGSGMTDAEAAEVMGALSERRADFEAVAALIDNVVEANRDIMLKEGLESEKTIAQWERTYQHYVPLKGWETGTDDLVGNIGSPSSGAGFDVRRSESERALGRASRADDILTNLLDQTQRTIIRAEKNRVAKTFLRFAQANPSPFYKIGLAEKKRHIDPLTGLVEEYWSNLPTHLDRVFAVKVSGKTHYIEIMHEGLLESLKSLGADKMNAFLRVMARLTREYSRFQTAKNPEFVFTNLIRDIQDAGFSVSAEQKERYTRSFFKNLLNGRALFGAILGTADAKPDSTYRRWFEEWREAGGKISHYGLKDMEELRKEFERELNQRTESTGKSIALAAPRMLNPINGKFVKFLEALSDVTESTTRLAVYISAREIGLTKAQAARMSRSATVDFNRRGVHSTTINAFYAFANANVQGNVRLLRVLRKSKIARRAAFGIVIAGMLMTYWNMSVSPEDDDKKRAYERRKYWERERNIIIYWPGSKVAAKIPLGYGLNVFWMMGEQLAMRMLGKVSSVEAIGNVMGTMVDAFNPTGSQGSFFDLATWTKGLFPTVLRPIPELTLNKNWAGNRIHPDPMPWTEGLPHSSQHKAFTHPVAVMAAELSNKLTGGNKFQPGWLDPYPDDLEYGWNFAVGGLGRFIANTSGTINDMVDGVDRPVERIPFVRRFVASDNSPSVQSNAYYEKRRESQVKARQLRAAVKARTEGTDDGSADAVIEKLGPELGARPGKNGRGVVVQPETVFRDADKQIKQLRQQEDTIRKDAKITRAERETRIRALREQMREIMGRARSNAAPAN